MRDVEDMRCFIHIPVGRVCEGLQHPKSLPSSCPLQSESAPVSTSHKCLQLHLPPVEMLPNSCNSEGKLVIACKFSAETSVALAVGMLYDEVIMQGGWVEKG